MSFHASTFLVCLAFLSSAIQAHHLEMKDANRVREADANLQQIKETVSQSLAPILMELKALSKKLDSTAAKCGAEPKEEPEEEPEVEPTEPACDPPCKNGAKCYKGKFCNCLPLGAGKFYGPQCDSFDDAGVRLMYGGEAKEEGVGRLEILVGGYWASVCADGLDEEKKLATAKKACAALGKPGKGKTYSGTNLQWLKRRHYGPIFLLKIKIYSPAHENNLGTFNYGSFRLSVLDAPR